MGLPTKLLCALKPVMVLLPEVIELCFFLRAVMALCLNALDAFLQQFAVGIAEFEHGVSCHHCLSEHSDADRARFRERQKQIELAKARGERHLAGGPV